MSKRWALAGLGLAPMALAVIVLILATEGCGRAGGRRAAGRSTNPSSPPPAGGAPAAAAPSQGSVKRMGNTAVGYVNPEFTYDGRYMLWFEQDRILPDGRPVGHMWHCAVNPDTGEMDPPDGKGFKAFETTLTGRANAGMDSRGVFYMGVDPDGRFVMVRPKSARQGDVIRLPTPPDPERRAIYPTALSDREGGYVYWLKSHGSPFPGRAEWVELQYMDISKPLEPVIVERQQRPMIGWTPLDGVFSYWFKPTPRLIYGVREGRNTQVKELDAARRITVGFLTDDPVDHINPYPYTWNGKRYLFSGIDRTDKSIIYVESTPGRPFTPLETIVPKGSTFAKPCLAQSHEPFEFKGRLYTTFQISDCGGRTRSFFSASGEVWAAEVGGSQRQWRISHDGDEVKNEPEAVVGRDNAWVFYTTYPKGSDPRNIRHELWRARVPID